jgi:hypothetical protein
MNKKKQYGPYNQYVPYEDVVYRLTGYYVYLGDKVLNYEEEYTT